MTAEKWVYSLDKYGEEYHGHCETREAAIAEARTELGVDARVEGFYVGRCVQVTKSQFMPSAEYILELMQESATDECGDGAEDFPDVSIEAGEELDALLKAWCEKHISRHSLPWTFVDAPEHIVPSSEKSE